MDILDMPYDKVIELYYEKHYLMQQGDITKLLELKNKFPEIFDKNIDDQIHDLIKGISWNFIAKRQEQILNRRGSSKKLQSQEPFTILSIVNDKNEVIQNIIYNHKGNCIVYVDFDQHGVSAPGHWHMLEEPGSPRRQKGEAHAYSYTTCPWIWLSIPKFLGEKELHLKRSLGKHQYQTMEIEFKGEEFKMQEAKKQPPAIKKSTMGEKIFTFFRSLARLRPIFHRIIGGYYGTGKVRPTSPSE